MMNESVASEGSSGPYRFGPFELDVRERRLTRDGQTVPLQRRPLQVLALLVENAGTLVRHAELRDRVWASAHVEYDQSIYFCIRAIRRALGDRADEPAYVQTVHGEGYRFVAPVSREGIASSPPPPPARRRHPRSRVLSAAALGTLTVVGGLFWIVAGRDVPRSPVVVELPAVETNGVTVTTLVRSVVASGGLTTDRQGNLYVGDWGPGTESPNGTNLFKITPDGDVSLVSREMKGVSHMVADDAGNVYVTNNAAGTVVRVTPDGATETVVRNLIDPTGIVLAENGTMYVAQCGAASIAKVAPGGRPEIFAMSALLRCPDGMVQVDDGSLYVCNFNSDTVVRVSPQGEVSPVTRVPDSNCTHLAYRDGEILLIAHLGNRVYRLTLDGQLAAFAGTGLRGHRDGPARLASFSRPNGIAVSPSGGTIYVNESVAVEGDRATPNMIRVIQVGRRR